MRPGKHICETLKGIRLDIARANDIEYHPTECDHKGDCAGTCPACESEVRWLERQLRLRQQLGKAVTIAGLSLGVSTLTGCTQIFHPSGKMAPTKQTNVPERRLEGDVVAVPNMLCDTVEPIDWGASKGNGFVFNQRHRAGRHGRGFAPDQTVGGHG